ncbi:MAG TPA: hypothetical protein DHW82_02650 [Spirochaetia bacterium]|nr:MAG: hypothetical protein A2Y41_10520 [Spirochaetes bacterium GWB1_36_13]HCL55891.1 hypothetical protein [Spirochaetia bacterium]
MENEIRWHQKFSFFFSAFAIEFLIIFLGWRYAGKYHDSEESFLIWLGAGSFFMIIFGSLWDNFGRKLLTVIGLFFSCLLGFAGGLGYFDREFFQRVLSGSYLDDMAAFFVFIFASNLLGLLLGFWIHHLVGSARIKRESIK